MDRVAARLAPEFAEFVDYCRDRTSYIENKTRRVHDVYNIREIFVTRLNFMMPDNPVPSVGVTQKQRLLDIFELLLPLLDNLASKLKLTVFLGCTVAVWLFVWFFYLKHLPLPVSAFAGIAALLPVAVLIKFWWAIEELRTLPKIAGQMMGDAKTELDESVQRLRTGAPFKSNMWSVGKNLWSVSALTSEVRELLGSYLSFTTLVNPIMLFLGVISFVGVFLLFSIGVVLAFFV